MKETLPNPGKMVLWELRPLSCYSGGFPSKVSIPCPQQLVFQFTGLLCSEQNKPELSNTFSLL